MKKLTSQSQLFISFDEGVTDTKPLIGRKYTITHSDTKGDVYIRISDRFYVEVYDSLYTRIMRDEVLAEWKTGPELHIYLHVSGGLIVGTDSWREKIFRKHLSDVIEDIRYADDKLFRKYNYLDNCDVYVHFISHRDRFDRIERFGKLKEYRV